jgi:heme exporter protein D
MDWFRMGYVYVGVGLAVAAMIALIVADLVRQILALLRPAETAAP